MTGQETGHFRCPFLNCQNEATELFELPGTPAQERWEQLTMKISKKPTIRCCTAHREVLTVWAGARIASW